LAASREERSASAPQAAENATKIKGNITRRRVAVRFGKTPSFLERSGRGDYIPSPRPVFARRDTEEEGRPVNDP
jgi:hypothetical protein